MLSAERSLRSGLCGAVFAERSLRSGLCGAVFAERSERIFGCPCGWRGRHGQCAAFQHAWRESDGLVVVLAGAAAGIRRGPQAAGHRGRRARAAAASVGLASEGRGEAARPATARSPGEPQPPTAGPPWPLFPRNCSRPSLLFTAGPSGLARRRCALEVVQRVVTTLPDSRCPIAVARARLLRISAGSWMPYAIRVPGTCGRH